MAYTTVNGFSALGDPTRRAIFERLAVRPRSVGELAGQLGDGLRAVGELLEDRAPRRVAEGVEVVPSVGLVSTHLR